MLPARQQRVAGAPRVHHVQGALAATSGDEVAAGAWFPLQAIQRLSAAALE
jgi:hypothetical protein